MSAQRTDALSKALFGKARRTVLALFFMQPERSFYLREVARLAGVGQGAAQRELARLTEAGILAKTMRGNQAHFQADPECPIYPELRGLMRKTAGLAEVLREALRPVARDVATAFIYGSQVSGEAGARSDVDLLVAGEVDELELHRALSKAERHLGRPVNYTLLSRRELRRRQSEKDGFLARVMRGEKIFILGDAAHV